jgi:hypothetical protein
MPTSINLPGQSSVDPVVQLHATLVQIDQKTNDPSQRLTEKQVLKLDEDWYAALKKLLTTPATTDEGRRVKARLFLQSLHELGGGVNEDTMTEAEQIAFSFISDVVGPSALTAMTVASAAA